MSLIHCNASSLSSGGGCRAAVDDRWPPGPWGAVRSERLAAAAPSCPGEDHSVSGNVFPRRSDGEAAWQGS